MTFPQFEIFFQLFLAALLGSVIGLERGFRGRAAGMRTYALVSLGAALFSVISMNAFPDFVGSTGFDPSRIISQIVVGIGFLGAGLMVFRTETPLGLTTAAALWVAAAVGVAVGVKMYSIASFTTFLVVTILYFLLKIEFRLYKKDRSHKDQGNE